MTGQQLLESSLRIVTGGLQFTPEQLDAALMVANSLKDSWSAEKFIQFDNVVESFPLVSGTAAYTMGTTGAFVTARPMKINTMYLRENDVDYPIDLLTDAEYAEISIKSGDPTYPRYAVVGMAVPDISIILWPVPSSGLTLFLDSSKIIADFTLDGDVNLPPEYFRAFKYAIALDLYPEYPTMQVPPTLPALVREAKQAIIKNNSGLVPAAKFDLFTGTGRYNIYRGY